MGRPSPGVATRDAPRRSQRPGVALAVLVTCQLMVVLDATVVNIALPTIQGCLHFSAADLSWVLNAYTLALGGLLWLGGRAGDILGQRRVFMVGVGLFTLASLLGGLATSPLWLLATRAAQGVGAAFAAPSVLALIVSNFEEGPARNRALGIFTAVSSGGASLGLIAGGMLTSWVSWRWVMFINVPIGVAVVLLAPLFVQESPRQTGRFDLAGVLVATVGMTSLVYGFIRAASKGWADDGTLAAFTAAVALLALFLSVESRAAQPIVPLRLFADRNRASAYLNVLLLPATMFGMFFFLTQFMQNVLGYSPLRAGVAFLPLTLMIFTASRTVPRLLPRFGPKPIMVVGAVLITAGMAWLSRISASTGYASGILGPMLLFGLGAGCSFMPLSVIILSGVRRHESGAAAGLLQTMQQAGGSLGMAILVTVYGSATRDAASHPMASAAVQAQARDILAHGVGSAFTVATLFIACALVVAAVAITATHSPKPASA